MIGAYTPNRLAENGHLKAISYAGPLAAAYEGFVQEKRAVGCLYNTEAKKLSEFSRFTLAFNYTETA